MEIVREITLENGQKVLKVDLEVADLSGEDEMVIGMNLFEPLGFAVTGVPFTWPLVIKEPELKKEKKFDLPEKLIDRDGIPFAWKKVLEDNQKIPIDNLCSLPGAEFSVEVGDIEPIWVKQYPIPPIA